MEYFRKRRRKRQLEAKRRWSRPQKGAWRFRAWASLLFADHGILRPVYWNSSQVADGVWRGPQPNPLHLRTLARRGFKTILNLRGQTPYGSYILEARAARHLGLRMIDLPLYSGMAPLKTQIHALKAAFDGAEKPLLIHCKSGADRTSFAATAYLLMQGVSPAQALRHMSHRYGHMKSGRAGILDAFFAAYIADTLHQPMDFMTWVDDIYDPELLEQQFKRPSLKSWVVDLILRRE